jgi:hypothetical protein
VDQQILFNSGSNNISQHPAYFVWEQHNVTLIRSPNYGYGIAISGGLNNNCNNNINNQDSSASIYISDIVPGGPAENKLMYMFLFV